MLLLSMHFVRSVEMQGYIIVLVIFYFKINRNETEFFEKM